MTIFSNPAGIWALTAVPIVLAIHFLQRKARPIQVSTLFLLEKTQRDVLHGSRINRLTTSTPLWLQLLAVLLATWLLMEPRYPSINHAQRIALVFDSSASLLVSKDALLAQLSKEMKSLQSLSRNTEWIALESDPSAPRLYQGKSIDDLLLRLRDWHPSCGEIDPTNALRLARSLVSDQGAVIYLTDTPPSTLSSGAIAISMGKKIDNVGFTGISFDLQNGQLVWRATLKNYSDQPTTRTWQLRLSNHQQTAPKTVQLQAHGLVTLQAALPSDADRAMLTLSSDDFSLDDSLHFVRPAVKQLSIAYSPHFQPIAEKIMRSINGLIAHTNGTADVSLLSYDPLDPQPIIGNTVVFVNDDTQGGRYLSGGILAEKHPWLDGLNWQSLLIRECIGMDVDPNDQVILQQGKRPLITVRNVPSSDCEGFHQQLLFHFDPRRSNLETQPAWIILLLRFINDIRDKKVAFFRENTELLQKFPLAQATIDQAPSVELQQLDLSGRIVERTKLPAQQPIVIPEHPGFYRFTQGDDTLCEIASHFADTREADFRRCGEINQCSQATLQAITLHSISDPLRPIWILLFLACLFASWFYSQKNQPVKLSQTTPQSANSYIGL